MEQMAHSKRLIHIYLMVKVLLLDVKELFVLSIMRHQMHGL